MAITTESFNADGVNKIFTVASTILSQSHCRVDFYYDDGSGSQTDHEIPSSDWDIINNSVVFETAPTDGYVVKITVSTDGEGLDTAPSIYSDIASNIDAIVNVNDNIDKVTTVADNIVDVNTVASSILDVNATGSNIDKVTTVADNIEAILKGLVYTVSDTEPSSASQGDMWYDTTEDNLKKYDGSVWIPAIKTDTTDTFTNKTLDDPSNDINANKFDGKESSDYVLAVDYEDQDVLDKVKNVDGAASGLDADKVRGYYINPYGFKNYIINGDFKVWQRGTAAVGGAGYKSADRWYQTYCTIERDVDAIGLPFAKCTCSDDDAANRVDQRIEDTRQFSNKTVTISFEIDSPDSLTDGKIYIDTKDNDDNDVILLDTDFQYTATRTRYSFTFDIDNTLLKDDHFVRCVIYGDRTDTNQKDKVFNVYNVQLEEGNVATPFEVRPIGLELSLCQRYYEKLVFPSGRYAFFAHASDSTSCRALVKCFPKRTVNSITTNIATSDCDAEFSDNDITDLEATYFFANTVQLSLTMDDSGGLEGCYGIYIRSGSFYIDIDAEL